MGEPEVIGLGELDAIGLAELGVITLPELRQRTSAVHETGEMRGRRLDQGEAPVPGVPGAVLGWLTGSLGGVAAKMRPRILLLAGNVAMRSLGLK